MPAYFAYQDLVERQLLAMGIARFDLATKSRPSALPKLHEGLFLLQIKDFLQQLHEQNLAGRLVLVRPHGEHGMSLVDGIGVDALTYMRTHGLEPAVVVQVARGRYQAWLRHDRKLSAEQNERVTRRLAELAGADPAVAHWDNFGCLAGFILPAAAMGTEEDFQVQLIEDRGVVYRRAAEIIEGQL